MKIKREIGHEGIYCTLQLIQSPFFLIEVLGGQFIFRNVNDSFTRLTGLSAEDVEDKIAFDFLPHRVAETVVSNYGRCVARRKEYSYNEVLTINGKETWWKTTLSPVLDEDGEVRYIIGMPVDVTDMQTYMIDLTRENSALKRLNDEISTFTAMAAHDLRPGIANIKSFVSLILDGFKDLGDGKIDKIKTVLKISDVMTDYVDRVLRHASSMNIAVKPHTEFLVDHVVRDIIAASDPESQFDIVYPTNLLVAGEEIIFQVIMRNLVENAARYARSRITIDIKTCDQRSGHLLLVIADDGNGFPGGVSGFRSHLSQDQAFGSRTSGFGLRAILQLVETRGGLFWLDLPRYGSGATMCVSIPGSIVSDSALPTSDPAGRSTNAATA